MNAKTVEEMLKKNPDMLKHEVTDDKLVLTAPTKDLQAFMLKHAGDKDFFGKAGNLKRAEPMGSNKSADPNAKP